MTQRSIASVQFFYSNWQTIRLVLELFFCRRHVPWLVGSKITSSYTTEQESGAEGTCSCLSSSSCFHAFNVSVETFFLVYV